MQQLSITRGKLTNNILSQREYKYLSLLKIQFFDVDGRVFLADWWTMKRTLHGWYTAAKLSVRVQQLYKQQQKKFSIKMHSIRCVKKGTLAIFDIMLLWTLVYCQLRGSPQGTKNKLSWNTQFWNSVSKSWLFLSCMRTSPTGPFAIQHGHLHVIFPISKDHKCFSLIQMWMEYFGVPWHAVLIPK